MRARFKGMMAVGVILVAAIVLAACGGSAGNKVKITFDSRGGSAVSSISVERGQIAAKPADPTRTGYEFGGWYISDTDFSTDTRWLFAGFAVNESITLYAYWIPHVYSVTFDGNKPEGAASTLTGILLPEIHVYDIPEILPENTFALEYWEFVGWNTAPDGSGTQYSDKQSVKNITADNEAVTLYAQWSSGFDSGVGISANPFIIKTPEQLILWAQRLNNNDYRTGYHFALGANINLANAEWTPIKSFYSTFDGRGHVISGFKITGKIDYVTLYGFFGTVYGTVKNLGLESFTIDVSIANEGTIWGSGLAVGSLAGRNEGFISNCYATGNVTARAAEGGGSSGNFAGGFVGFNNDLIRDCYFNGTVIASGYFIDVGGFVGSTSTSYVRNCFVSGRVEASGGGCYASRFGRIVYASGNENCYSHENIYITPYVEAPSGTNCTESQLNSPSFYTDTLGWSASVWDFSNLSFSNGRLPKLKVS